MTACLLGEILLGLQQQQPEPVVVAAAAAALVVGGAVAAGAADERGPVERESSAADQALSAYLVASFEAFGTAIARPACW